MALPLFVVFCIFAIASIALALGRAAIVRFKADDCLHLTDAEVAVIEEQKIAAKRLQWVDIVGKTCTALAAVTGIAAYVVWWIGE